LSFECKSSTTSPSIKPFNLGHVVYKLYVENTPTSMTDALTGSPGTLFFLLRKLQMRVGWVKMEIFHQ